MVAVEWMHPTGTMRLFQSSQEHTIYAREFQSKRNKVPGDGELG